MNNNLSPTYLVKNPFSYCFRMIVPKDLQPTIDRKELRYSLGTGNLSVAKRKARYMAGQVQQLFRDIQRGRLKYMKLSSTQIQNMIKKFRDRLMQEYDKPAKSNRQMDEQDYHTWASDSEKRWSEDKSRNKPWNCMQVLIDYFRDAPINTITRDMVIQFKTDLWKLPPNMRMAKKFKGKDIHEIIAMEPKQTIEEQTVSDYFGWAKALFEHVEDIKEIDRSPSRNMTIKKTKRPHESRQIFSKDDLKKLFTSPEYSEDTFSKSYQFWTPLLALYTGARQNEIAQLHLDDFQFYDGFLCININDVGDKKLKNKSSKRLIPLHPVLVKELNILNRVDKLKMQGKKRFFPELSRGRDGYGKNVSRWFNETFRMSCGITKESKKSLS